MRFECWEKQIAAKKSECGESDNAESTAAALDRARHATLGSPAALVQRPHFCRSGQTPRAPPLALLGPRDRRQKVARLHHCRQIRVRQGLHADQCRDAWHPPLAAAVHTKAAV